MHVLGVGLQFDFDFGSWIRSQNDINPSGTNFVEYFISKFEL